MVRHASFLGVSSEENATGQATNVYRAMVRGSGSTDKHSFSSVRNCCPTELFDVLDLNTGSALEFRMLPDGTFSSICVNRKGIRTLFRFMNTFVQFCGEHMHLFGFVSILSWTLDLLLSNIGQHTVFLNIRIVSSGSSSLVRYVLRLWNCSQLNKDNSKESTRLPE